MVCNHAIAIFASEFRSFVFNELMRRLKWWEGIYLPRFRNLVQTKVFPKIHFIYNIANPHRNGQTILLIFWDYMLSIIPTDNSTSLISIFIRFWYDCFYNLICRLLNAQINCDTQYHTMIVQGAYRQSQPFMPRTTHNDVTPHNI